MRRPRPGTGEKMDSGECEVSLCWHTALPTPCPLLLAPPFPLHLPPKIYSRNCPQGTASACCCHHCWLCGEAASPPCSGQGWDIACLSRGQNGPEEKRWWGHDKAQSLTLLCVPSTSGESQISPNLLPPSSNFTLNISGVASHVVSPSPSHTSPHHQARMSPERMT